MTAFWMAAHVDGHSHVFHRALRGRTTGTDFWAWRREMYELVDRLDPDTLLALATAGFAEMVLAGITTVHEFHYLHQPEGMDDAICEAARRAGIRLVLLDTCYLRAGFGDDELDPVQQRFSDGEVDRWAARAEKVAAANPDVVVGAAIHSVRAVDEQAMREVAVWAHTRGVPLHIHLSEQRAENDACIAATGKTPVQLSHDAGVLGPTTTAVHCVHVDDRDIAELASTATKVCLCPTTERDLGDGVAPASDLARAGCSFRVGTDSHAVVDLFEEARLMDLHERLVSGRRGLRTHFAALDAICGDGRLAVDLDSVRLAGADPDDPVPMIVAAATAADVTDVEIDGRTVVADRHHVSINVPSALRAAIAAVT